MEQWIISIISATIWAIVGYLAKQPDEAFDKGKIFFTFVAALVVGILAVNWNIPEEQGYQFYLYLLERSGFVGVVYKALRALYIKSGLREWWNNLPTE